MQTFPDLIERFGGAATMAPEIGASANTIRQWASRGSIPGRHWKSILDAAQRLGIDGVTADKLAELASANGAAPAETEVAAMPAAPFPGAAGPGAAKAAD